MYDALLDLLRYSYDNYYRAIDDHDIKTANRYFKFINNIHSMIIDILNH